MPVVYCEVNALPPIPVAKEAFMAGMNGAPPFDGPEPPWNLVSQLLRAMDTMRSLDEMFVWLASALTQGLKVPLAQFWTPHTPPGAHLPVRLLAMDCLDASVPERVIVNEQIIRIVERVAFERRPSLFFQVEQGFSPHQAALLTRFGFQYCGCAFLESGIPLFQLEGVGAREASPPRFAVIPFLLLRQLPRRDLLTSLAAAIEQGLLRAVSLGLLLSSASNVAPSPFSAAPLTPTPPPAYPTPARPISQPIPPPTPAQPEQAPPLEALIPRRKQDPDLLTANNPFTSAPVIADKQARRFHTAIDGRKNVGELCRTTGMSLKEGYEALRYLLAQQRVELYDPKGRPIQPDLFGQGA
jgi:hypothetical protein